MAQHRVVVRLATVAFDRAPLRARDTVTVTSSAEASRPTNPVPYSVFNAAATRSGSAHASTGIPI